MSPHSSPEQTAGRMSLLLSVTTNQIDDCSNWAGGKKFIFLKQISNGGCKGVVLSDVCWHLMWKRRPSSPSVNLCKINVFKYNQYVFLLIFMSSTKTTTRQSTTCVGYLTFDIIFTFKFWIYLTDPIGHSRVQPSLLLTWGGWREQAKWSLLNPLWKWNK